MVFEDPNIKLDRIKRLAAVGNPAAITTAQELRSDQQKQAMAIAMDNQVLRQQQQAAFVTSVKDSNNNRAKLVGR